MNLYVSAIVPAVHTLGPGKRIGLWLEGCSLRCQGCMTPELFVRRPEHLRPVDQVFAEIASLAAEHHGLTVSGGEPSEQARPLAALLHRVHRETGLDVMVYSGLRLDEIRNGGLTRPLLDAVDLLMDGRFERDCPTEKPWRGSDNQVMHVLSARGRARLEASGGALRAQQALHVGFDGEGCLRLIGIPKRHALSTFRARLRARGIILRRRA